MINVIEKKEIQKIENIKFTEAALIAGILVDNRVMKDAEILNSNDFYDTRHREIFGLIKEKYEAGDAVDLTSFAGTEYQDYVLNLMELPESLVNHSEYVKKIKEASVERQKILLIDNFKNKLIDYDTFISSLQKLQIPKKNIISSIELIDNIKPVDSANVFGINIQYGAILTIAGATSAGKTEFALEIADIHAQQEDCVSIYCIFEGGINEFALRLKKKKILNENLYMLHNPSYFDISAAVEKFKDKKVLIIIDYLQMFARRLQANDNRPSDFLKKYTSLIYAKLDDIRTQYNNVCIMQLSALNNAGIGEIRNLKEFDDTVFLKSLKEDGNIQYDSDYIYSMLFADDTEKEQGKWSLGRKKIDKMRKYIMLHPVKSGRIIEIEDVQYVYNAESCRYEKIENIKYAEITTKETKKEPEEPDWDDPDVWFGRK